jgi:hypothetical protein
MTELPRLSIILFALVLVLVPASSHAYLDPGTGSYILQIVIGVLLAAALAVRAFWHRIKTYLASLFSSKRKGK